MSRLGELLISESTRDAETISTKHLLKVLGQEKDFNTEAFLDRPMVEYLKEVSDKLKIPKLQEKIKNLSHQERIELFAEQIAKNIAGRNESRFKAYNKYQGIILSLLILPFSCTALNWAYPRVMEKCFPKLSQAKADSASANNVKGGKA